MNVVGLCGLCQCDLFEKTLFSAWNEKKGKRVDLCKTCLGEVEFDILPKVTGPTSNTPMGGAGGGEEDSPWQQNARRALEGD